MDELITAYLINNVRILFFRIQTQPHIILLTLQAYNNHNRFYELLGGQTKELIEIGCAVHTYNAALALGVVLHGI